MDLLKAVNSDGMTMIIVTHEHEIAEQTNRIIHLKDGMVENDVNDAVQKQKVFESLMEEEN